jgi:hypothetical protein
MGEIVGARPIHHPVPKLLTRWSRRLESHKKSTGFATLVLRYFEVPVPNNNGKCCKNTKNRYLISMMFTSITTVIFER